MSSHEKFVGYSDGKCIPFDGIRHYSKTHSREETIDYTKKAFKRLSRMVYPKDIVEEFPLYRQLLHKLAYSGILIGAIALYEYIRVHRPDLALPDLKPLVPAASTSVSDAEGVHPFGKNTTIHMSNDGKGNISILEHTERGSLFHHVKSGFEIKDHGVQK